MRLKPLADASDPIMAQAAFLSSLVGVEVAEAAASAAVKTLSEVNNESKTEIHGSTSVADGARDQESSETENGKTTKNSLEGAYLEAKLQLEKEEEELERNISDVVDVQVKEIHKKIVHFEELELQMEKEWQQLQQMQNLLFADQLTLLFDKGAKRE